MKVVQQGKKDTYEDMYPSEYEYKLCGGSVEPKDRIIHLQGETELQNEGQKNK